MRIRRSVALIVVLGVGLAMGACANLPAPVETPNAALPSPSATVAPTVVAVPEQVFDGSCAELFTDAEVSDAIGYAVTLKPHAGAVLGSLVLPHAGGIACEWGSSIPGDASVKVEAVSATLVRFPESSGCMDYADSGILCVIDASSRGIRLDGSVRNALSDMNQLVEAAYALETLFSARASETTVTVPETAATAWDLVSPNDCTRIAGSVPPNFMGTALGFADADPYATPIYRALRGEGLGYCSVYDLTSSREKLQFAVLGGGRWAEETVANQPDTTVTEIPGFERVYVGPLLSTGHRYIDIFDGVNWLQAFVEESQVESSYEVLKHIVSALNV